MKITAHSNFRLTGVCFLLGFHDFDPRGRRPIISSRSSVRAGPGDVIDNIWEMDGVWIAEIDGPAPDHPLLQDTGDEVYRLDVESLGKDFQFPVEIPRLMTIEE